MKSYIIDKNNSSQRVDKFVQRLCPELPFSMICKYFRLKRIKVNSKKVQINYLLKQKDVVELYINDEQFVQTNENKNICEGSLPKSPYNIRKMIVFEDDNIMILDKPAGLLCHSGNSSNDSNLTDIATDYLRQKQTASTPLFAPALCNRIDRNTSGLIILAKNYLACNLMSKIIRDDLIKKEYLAIIYCKNIVITSGTFIGYMDISQKENIVRVFTDHREGSKMIKTQYSILAQNNDLALLKIALHTGRKHQIRAHLAHLDMPVLGDDKYGSIDANRKYGIKYQQLCSYKLTFSDNLEDALQNDLLNNLNGKIFCAELPAFVNENFTEIGDKGFEF